MVAREVKTNACTTCTMSVKASAVPIFANEDWSAKEGEFVYESMAKCFVKY